MQLSVTDNNCHVSFALELIMLRTGIAHSWLRMESSADWLYVDCYWHMLAFSIPISIVFNFNFYIFYFVYPVYEFHFK